MASTVPPLLTTTSTFPRDPRLYARDHATFMRESLRDGAVEHHRRHIPWHFEKFAASKYGYLKRSSKYQARKDRLGLPPLVSPNPQTSGQLRTAMIQFREVTATQQRSRLILRLPFQGGTGRLRVTGGALTSSQRNVLNRIAEMEAVASDESDYLVDFVGERYTQRANLPGVRYRKRSSP